MKIFIATILLFCFASLSFSNEKLLEKKIIDFNKIFNLINQKRVGLNINSIVSNKNPFKIKHDVNETNSKIYMKQKNVLELNIILNNRAKINGVWYNLNDIIGEYKIIKIKPKSVVFANADTTKELKINQRNENVNISIK